MNKVKIISNPYEKKVLFERWNNQLNSWVTIDQENNSNSKLISNDFQSGFFPFKVFEIVHQIIDEYSVSDEPLLISFSGSDDEFQELENLLLDTEFESIELEKSESYLENARDVLPEINKIFKKLDPLITKNIEDESGEIQQQLKRFSDASNDIVPICVLGTYSAGKSTFINSLIGCELLPSAETPVTAKVYKLSSTNQKDRASVRFTFKDEEVKILVRADKLVFDGLESEDELIDSINLAIQEEKASSIIEKVHLILEEVNDYSDSELGDLIEIEIPFGRSTLDEVNYQIAIFDTPGSNSSTNLQHSDVLDKSMKGMSNGLPIFVTDSSSMDSTDNDNLKDKLKKVSGLDSRFTMIVVNKAESADINLRKFQKESFRQKIMNQTIPRELYAQGIFYVSSILGLGSKLNGELRGEFYSELFDTYKVKYSDSSNDYYKRLFDFNIVPPQMKQTMVKSAESNQNCIYANSGLLTIEDAIKNFVIKYSHYDKCQQARETLNRLIIITDKEIDDKNEDLIGRKLELQNKLDDKKASTLATIDDRMSKERGEHTTKYPQEMVSFIQSLTQILKKENVESHYSNYYEKYSQEYPEIVVEDGHDETNLFRKLKGQIDGAVQQFKSSEDRRRKIEEKASVEVLDDVKKQFSDRLIKAKESFNQFSKEFWINATSDVRTELEKVIAGDLELEPEKRKEISDMIISYEDINFDRFDLGKFNRDELSYIFRIGDFKLKSNKINISGLTNTYNKEFKAKLTEFSDSIRSEHELKFYNWTQDLGSLIKSNIIEFSPELKELDRKIEKICREIYSLEIQQKQIKAYVTQIKRMISWK